MTEDTPYGQANISASVKDTHMTFDLDAAAMTKREALEIAHQRLTSVVAYCLDEGLELDAMDKASIRTAHEMVALAIKQ